MAISPPTAPRGRPGGFGGGINIGGGRRRITRPFEDLREKDEKKRDDDEDAKRKHEPRR